MTTGPLDSDFYNRPSEDIFKELPGERVLTPSDILVIHMTEGFNGLVRKGMEADFRRLEEADNVVPGTISVTNFRGWPQLNVLGDCSESPQLTWLKELGRNGEKVSSTAMVKGIAEELGDDVPSNKEAFEYAVETLEGQNVQDPESLIRIIPNADMPSIDKRQMSVEPHAGSAKNSAGVASLTVVPGTIVTSKEQLQIIVDQEAARLGHEPEELLHPSRLGWVLKKSPILRQVIGQLAHKKMLPDN